MKSRPTPANCRFLATRCQIAASWNSPPGMYDEDMHRSLLIAVSLAGIFAGCSRIAREPTRKIEVPDSGFPVLTTEERAAQEKAGQTDAAAESPRLVSQAS